MDQRDIEKLKAEWEPRIAAEKELAVKKREQLAYQLKAYDSCVARDHNRREAVSHKIMDIAQELWGMERQIWHIQRFLENVTGEHYGSSQD